MAKTRVLVVDDQLVVRQLFEIYLKSNKKYEIAALLPSAAMVCDFINTNPVDLILLDILMNDGSNGLDVACEIKKDHPDIKIIAVTAMAEMSWLKRARKIGIESFYYKEAPQQTIIDIIDRTMAGECIYPDASPDINIGLMCSKSFSKREIDILRLMTTGMSNSKIAKELCISEGTVKTHIHSMLKKTGCDNRTELAIEARVKGVVVQLNKT